MANLNSFEMFLGQALQAAKVDMLRKRSAAKAEKVLAANLLEKEMLASLAAKNFSF